MSDISHCAVAVFEVWTGVLDSKASVNYPLKRDYICPALWIKMGTLIVRRTGGVPQGLHG